jgi:methenyltetrahydromethanopterin cyclohydrolase
LGDSATDDATALLALGTGGWQILHGWYFAAASGSDIAILLKRSELQLAR